MMRRYRPEEGGRTYDLDPDRCALRSHGPCRNRRLLSTVPLTSQGRINLALGSGSAQPRRLCLAPHSPPRRQRTGLCCLWRCVRGSGPRLAEGRGRREAHRLRLDWSRNRRAWYGGYRLWLDSKRVRRMTPYPTDQTSTLLSCIVWPLLA